jgi:hypothetical protein
LPEVKQVKLERGARPVIAVVLLRDPSSPFWRKPPRPSRFLLEIEDAVLLMLTFGGDVAGRCLDSCRQDIGAGGYLAVHGGYELGSRVGFGIAAGYLAATQTITDRGTSIQPIGLQDDRGVANDDLRLRGVFAGTWAGFTFDTAFPVHLRLGAGGLFGSVSDLRTGTFQAREGSYLVGPILEKHAASFIYVTPEVRVGLPLGRHAEINAGLAVPILIAASQAKWDETHPINAGSDGYATFAGGALSGSVLAIFAPGIGACYDF